MLNRGQFTQVGAHRVQPPWQKLRLCRVEKGGKIAEGKAVGGSASSRPIASEMSQSGEAAMLKKESWLSAWPPKVCVVSPCRRALGFHLRSWSPSLMSQYDLLRYRPRLDPRF